MNRTHLPMLAAVLAGCLIAPAALSADASLASAKRAKIDKFDSEKAVDPPAAYLDAAGYIMNYGLDAAGLQCKKWMDAYAAKVPAIYQQHDADFGLYSENLPLVAESALWFASRHRIPIKQLLIPDPQSYIMVTAGGAAGYMFPDGPLSQLGAAIKAANAGQKPIASIQIWSPQDWQAIVGGALANPSSPHADLTDFLTKVVAAHKQPTGIFGYADKWLAQYDQNGFWWNGIDDELVAKLKDLSQQGAAVRIVCIPNATSWVVLWGNNSATWKNIPPHLAGVLTAQAKANTYVESVGLFQNEKWFVKITK